MIWADWAGLVLVTAGRAVRMGKGWNREARRATMAAALQAVGCPLLGAGAGRARFALCALSLSAVRVCPPVGMGAQRLSIKARCI